MVLYIQKKLFSRIKTIKGSTIAISWLFLIYIIANIEIGTINEMRFITVFCMIIEALMIGFFEEIVFRGTILPLFLNKWHHSKKEIIFSVLISSSIFGCVHLINLSTGVNPNVVFFQVIYTTIMGIAFSSLFLRTNGNLIWCCILHGFYDIAGGFGDFSKVTDVTQSVSQVASNSIVPYVINICLFLPLLIYSLFLLKKYEYNVLI